MSAAVDYGPWTGAITLTEPASVVSLVAIAPEVYVPDTANSPIRCLDSDGRLWWVKQALPGWPTQVVALEFLVAQLGRLIGAPMCTTALVQPTQRVAQESRVCPGISHGCLDISQALLKRPHLAFRRADNNRVRHVGIYALWDWCFGRDGQWLHDIANDRATYSHDHDAYLLGLDESQLVSYVNTPWVMPDDPVDLDAVECEAVADRLNALTRVDLIAALQAVPDSWQIPVASLEALGWFLEVRAPGVATRLRASGGVP